jgi:hypothetical protein
MCVTHPPSSVMVLRMLHHVLPNGACGSTLITSYYALCCAAATHNQQSALVMEARRQKRKEVYMLLPDGTLKTVPTTTGTNADGGVFVLLCVRIHPSALPHSLPLSNSRFL